LHVLFDDTDPIDIDFLGDAGDIYQIFFSKNIMITPPWS